MAEEANEGLYVIERKLVTLTFPNLIEPRAVTNNGKPSGEPKYSASLEFDLDHPDLAPLKAKAAAIAKARWPGRDLKELQFPFSDGNKLADKAKARGKDREFSRGKVVFVARSKFRPDLSVISNGKLLDLTDDAAVLAQQRAFYSGVQVSAQVTLKAYDGVGNNPDGVNAYLDKVLSFNKGERVAGGGRSAAETFKGYAGLVSNEDPTVGADLDDEIPF